jgi:hypothetical protein
VTETFEATKSIGIALKQKYKMILDAPLLQNDRELVKQIKEMMDLVDVLEQQVEAFKEEVKE